jgi:DhnA family fructose-bisphosphate aldolase class Ia
MKIIRVLWVALLLFGLTLPLTRSTVLVVTAQEKASQLTRGLEFDYVSWLLEATGIKMGETGIAVAQRLTAPQQHQLVKRYFALVSDLETVTFEVQQIYTDPKVSDPQSKAADLLNKQEEIQSALQRLDPLVESILQQQVASTLVKMGIARLGEPFPPVLYHTSATPKSLITSAREKISRDVDISLLSDLTLAEISALEDQVEQSTGESALVVGTGGIGVYPTMIMRTSNLAWVVNTIAHEWTHNYLTIRPLGLNYDTNYELRTMNETVASIAGNEIGAEVIKTYYPELATEVNAAKLAAPLQEDAFNFQAEMHETRVTVDALLAEGKITEAESYMEARRQVFVAHGYLIRKLNQAYFAFYGAYADAPVGAAGEDPVGQAVRDFRAQSSSLAAFLRQMGAMNSFADLQKATE